MSEEVNGLERFKTYHYRLKATNSAGTTFSPDQTFTVPDYPYAFSGYLGSSGSGNGELDEPRGLALDAEGDLWVADDGNNRVQQFSPSGQFLSKFEGSGETKFEKPVDLVLTSSGDVWVLDAVKRRAERFSSSGQYLSQFGKAGSGNGEFASEPTGIDVGPNGHIWVSAAKGVQEFTSGGQFIQSVNFSCSCSTRDVSIDSEGHVWVLGAPKGVAELSPAGAVLGEVAIFGEELEVTEGGRLLVSRVEPASDRVQEYLKTGELVGEVAGGPQEWEFDPYGIAAGPGRVFYVANFGRDWIERWIGGSKPIVSTGSASEITTRGAKLSGKVNPTGLATTYQFEYGTTTAYGASAPVPGKGIGAGIEEQDASETIGGLKLGTIYHYRLAATNSEGTTFGKDKTFTTVASGKPVATTGGDSEVGASKAVLNATVNPEGAATSYRFEYGKTTSYGTNVPIPDKAIGAGENDVAVSQEVSGLASQTTYHFRVVATNAHATVYGSDVAFTTCKGSGCTWSTQTTPNPTPRTEAKLEDVSCASASMCMAAGTDGYTGRGFGESWNGSEWKTLFTDISGFQPRGVACTSTTSCIVAGSDGSGTPKAELWQYEAFVSEWVRIAKTVPSPEGATSVKLNDVSCTSASACTAVGSYLKEGKTKTLAERYNGTSFSIQTTANPEAGSAELLGVSCASATSCFAVGKKGGETFAQSWNGTTWSISTTPNPSGAEQSILRSVSCTSASACTAVGYSVKTEISKPREALIERYNGTSWSIQTAAAPAGGVGNVEFSAVTCPSASSCVAVGEYATENVSGLYIPEASKTLIESWNGSTWSVQASPNVEGKKANLLAGVSCTATSACTAVGNARASYGSGQYVTLGERWNGSTWSTQTTPNPTPRTEAKLEDVSCASASMCMAAGTDGYTGRGFGESWNGSEWKTLFTDISGFQPRGVACTSTTSCIVAGSDGSGTPKAELWQYEAFVSEWVRIAKTVPSPEGATSVKLNDVSCTSASACTAVGSYLKEGKTKTLAERYNGTSFSIQTTANPEAGSAELLGVSCASATSCFAVGKKGGETFAQSWNGTTWSISTTPNPSGAEQSILRSVSCTSASACTAVGYSVKTEISKPREALIERYNGTSWSIQTAAAPAGGVGNVEFSAVTCPSASSCVAVGEYATENVSGLYIPEASKTLIESWNGSTWSVQASPNVEGKKANLLAGVSCTATSACTAVGNARASYGSGQYVTLGERWE